MSYFYPPSLVRTMSTRTDNPCLAIEEHTFTSEHAGTEIMGYTFMLYFGPANERTLSAVYKFVSLMEHDIPDAYMILSEDTDRAGNVFPKVVFTCSTVTVDGRRAGREFIDTCISAGVSVSNVELDAVVRALEPQAED